MLAHLTFEQHRPSTRCTLAKSTVKGVERLIAAIEKRKEDHAKNFERGLTRAGLWLLRESMQIVPIDTSALKNSGPMVTRAEGSGFGTIMVVGYGQDYAIYVHEDLLALHAPGKQAKFLEQPAREGRPTMRQIIVEEMRK